MTNLNEQITDAFIACVTKASELWISVRNYKFTLDICEFPAKHAQAAGLANRMDMTIKINIAHARANIDHIVNDTIPHEVAHLVQQILRPNAKQAHGPEWRAICVALGGNGKRCYAEEDFPGMKIGVKRRSRHTYNVAGEVMELGPKHHNAIQRGTLRIISRKTKMVITKDMYVSSRIQ